ncbi:MAG: hypothetical protein J7K22_00915 [Nanoarchaeota archaeon]|nr:hypothetical protein [Nanoarchaeota archaeon]
MKGLKLNDILNHCIGNVQIREYLNILGYTSTITILGLLAEDILYNFFIHKEAVVYASMSMHNEHYIELPLLVYTLLWNTQKGVKYFQRTLNR